MAKTIATILHFCSLYSLTTKTKIIFQHIFPWLVSWTKTNIQRKLFIFFYNHLQSVRDMTQSSMPIVRTATMMSRVPARSV